MKQALKAGSAASEGAALVSQGKAALAVKEGKREVYAFRAGE
jgi:hypothetical protein